MRGLEKEVHDRTIELEQSKDFLQAIVDSSLDMIQVFKAVRDKRDKIVDFEWILINKISEEIFGDTNGKKLLENNPGVVETGIFDAFVKVVESRVPQQYEKQYPHEQFDGWFFQSVVKLFDGVATSTKDITVRKQAEFEIQALNRKLVRNNRDLESLNSELQTFTSIAANDYKVTLHKLYVGFEQVLKLDAGKLSDSSKAALRRSQSSLQKLKMLTEDIISFAGVSELDKQTMNVDLNDVASRAWQDLRQKVVKKMR